MSAVSEKYVSEYGWSIWLPPQWEPLASSAEKDQLVLTRPEVFAWNRDWTVSMTWTMQVGQAEPDVVSRFDTLTMSAGPVSPGEAQSVVQSVTPLIGEATSAEVVDLTDGSRALEITESFVQEATGEAKKGYHLILALTEGPDRPTYFQRLSFYAPAAVFDQHIYNIRLSARSFRYERPFGQLEQESAD